MQSLLGFGACYRPISHILLSIAMQDESITSFIQSDLQHVMHCFLINLYEFIFDLLLDIFYKSIYRKYWIHIQYKMLQINLGTNKKFNTNNLHLPNKQKVESLNEDHYRRDQ